MYLDPNKAIGDGRGAALSTFSSTKAKACAPRGSCSPTFGPVPLPATGLARAIGVAASHLGGLPLGLECHQAQDQGSAENLGRRRLGRRISGRFAPIRKKVRIKDFIYFWGTKIINAKIETDIRKIIFFQPITFLLQENGVGLLLPYPARERSAGKGRDP